MWSDGMTAAQISAERSAGTFGSGMPDSERGRSYGDTYGGSSPSQGGFGGRNSDHIGSGGLYAQGGLIERMAGGGQVMQRNDPFYGPVMMQEGGIANIGAMQQEAPAQAPNEREMISEAVAAIKGQHPQPEVPLGAFLAQYGEEAFRDLVDRVQSGEMDDTAERSEGQLNGPGDGMDDLIPATIDGQQDVLLSDGEYIIPADVVSHLGNGSTDAGARALDQMAERVREARTGRPQQAPQVPQEQMMPV